VSAHAHRPTVLIVGDGEPMEEAIRQALTRHGVVVHRAKTAEVITSVRDHAPDLVLLVGDAVADDGGRALRQLAGNAASSVVPVALLIDDMGLDQRLRAFRSGAVGVVHRGASADAAATRIAELVRELPQRPGEAAGALGEATLDELVELISKELRTGILSVEREQAKDPIRVVLGAGEPVAQALDAFVRRLKPLIAQAEPLRYEFHETSGGRLQLLEADDEAGDLTHLEGLRILLMDNDPGRADVLAQALRDRGALVAVMDVGPRGLERARALDPEVIVLDAAAIEGSGFEAVRAMRRDPRLRWASLLVARWDELWPKGSESPDVAQLAGRIAPLTQHDRALRGRAEREDAFDTRLELTGPSRLVRSLARCTGTRHVTVRAANATVEIDVSDGLVVGCFGVVEGVDVSGVQGLAYLLALTAGRVRVERKQHPAAANVMSPVDEALAAAQRETPQLKSQPPPPIAEESKKSSRPFPTAEELKSGESEVPPDEVEVDPEPTGSGPLYAPHLRAATRLGQTASNLQPSEGELRWGETAKPRARRPQPKLTPPAFSPPRPKRPEKKTPIPSPSVVRPRGMPTPKPFEAPKKAHSDLPSPKKAPPPSASASDAPKPKKQRMKTVMGLGAMSPPKPLTPPSSDGRPSSPPIARVNLKKHAVRSVPPEAIGSRPPPPSSSRATMMGLGLEAPAKLEETKKPAPVKTPPPSGLPAVLGDDEDEDEDETSQSSGLPAVLGESEPPEPPDHPPIGDDDEATVIGDSLAITEALQQSAHETPTQRPPAPEDDDAIESGLDGIFGDIEDEEDDGIDPLAATAAAAAPFDPAAPIEAPATPAAPEAPRPPEPPAHEGPEDTEVLTRPTKKKSRGPMIALASVLLLGGGAAAVLLVGPKVAPDVIPDVFASEPTSPEPVTPVTAMTPAAMTETPATMTETAATMAATMTETAATMTETLATTMSETPATTMTEPTTEPAMTEEPVAMTMAESTTEPSVPEELSPRERAQQSDALAAEAERQVARGDLDGAQETLRESEALDERNPQMMAAWAQYYLAREDADQAVEWATKATRRRARRAAYHLLLGDARQMAGDPGGARRSWQRALERDPDNAEIQRRLR